MQHYILFWLAKSLADALVYLLIASPLLIFFLFLALKGYLKQKLCKHKSYRENMACSAICRNCNKNLGFIGTVRDQRNRDKV